MTVITFHVASIQIFNCNVLEAGGARIVPMLRTIKLSNLKDSSVMRRNPMRQTK